jgi:cardiolipin synthase A/B
LKLALSETLERGLASARYSAEPSRLRPGHRLMVLIDGLETYPAMLEAIARARSYIHLESYIFESDSIGRTFVAALCERARAGVEVRLLVDGVGSLGFDSAAGPELAEAGVELAIYGPLRRRWSVKRWLRRDHRKILVVDGKQAFVGGINIGLEYAPREQGGGGWRDTHMAVGGPAVVELEAMFRQTWEAAGGRPYRARPRAGDESAAVAGTEWAMTLGSDHGGMRSDIRRHIMHALRHSRSRVWAACAYFVPDRAMRRAFRAAARRGVDVRVIVPARSDLRSVQWAGEYTYGGLMRGGVRIFQWCDTHMHAKTLVIDGVWSMVGSYNLDYVSLFLNQEVVLVAIGEHTAGRLEAAFRTDLGPCREIELESWLRRSWLRRALAWLFYRFRRFL